MDLLIKSNGMRFKITGLPSRKTEDERLKEKHDSEHFLFKRLGRRGDAGQRKFLAKNFRAFKKKM